MEAIEMGASCSYHRCIPSPSALPLAARTTYQATHAAGDLSLQWHTIHQCSLGWLFLPAWAAVNSVGEAGGKVPVHSRQVAGCMQAWEELAKAALVIGALPQRKVPGSMQSLVDGLGTCGEGGLPWRGDGVHL